MFGGFAAEVFWVAERLTTLWWFVTHLLRKFR